jgi:thioredoxin reductase
VIGAGPVGLAAAAHLASRNLPFVVLEAGASVGASVRRWGHVRLFSPWRYNLDRAALALLTPAGWVAPDGEVYPTGADLVTAYLEPLAALPQIAPHLRLATTVQAVTRQGFDKMKTVGRESAPFVVQVATADGAETTILARAVIDASGTYTAPNPLGSSGVPAPGERALAERIVYGIPDVLGADRARYAGRRVLVLGSGHSAFNALLDLATLAQEAPGTTILWAIRRPTTDSLYGGGSRDQLPERASIGGRIAALVDSGAVRLVPNFQVQGLRATADGVVVEGADGALPPVDTIIGATGFRPDLGFLRELRLGLDSTVESPTALAPLIDPNLHSCGTVPPHGVVELTHPEADFYMVGMKSYGRAPTFLMLTGYEQVRSVVAALAGDRAAAEEVELVLPETGVCSTDRTAGSAGCCGATPVAAGASCAPARGSRPVIALTPVGAGSTSCCG